MLIRDDRLSPGTGGAYRERTRKIDEDLMKTNSSPRRCLVAALATALSLALALVLPTTAAHAQELTVDFAQTPVFGTTSGIYTVKLSVTPEIPTPELGVTDEVKLGVLLVRRGQNFDPATRRGAKTLLETSYRGFGGDNEWTLSDYVPQSSLPAPGDRLLPYLQTSAYGASFTLEETGFYLGNSYTMPGASDPADTTSGTAEGSEKANSGLAGGNPENGTVVTVGPSRGSIRVRFVAEDGREVPSTGAFSIQKLIFGDFGFTVGNPTDLEFHNYKVAVDQVPTGYELAAGQASSQKIELSLENADPVVEFRLRSLSVAPVTGEAPSEGEIPTVNLTPVLAPDHPNVFIRIEDNNVHPVNGLQISWLNHRKERSKILAPKLNTSDESPYRILSLPLKELPLVGEGTYWVVLSQPGYAETYVRVDIAPRTQLPVVAKENRGYVFLDEGSFTVDTEKDAVLDISFLLDPRLEEGIIHLDPQRDIATDLQGHFVVDFSRFADQLTKHRVVKVIARAPGLADSEIVEVALRKNASEVAASAADNPEEQSGAKEENSDKEAGEQAGERQGNSPAGDSATNGEQNGERQGNSAGGINANGATAPSAGGGTPPARPAFPSLPSSPAATGSTPSATPGAVSQPAQPSAQPSENRPPVLGVVESPSQPLPGPVSAGEQPSAPTAGEPGLTTLQPAPATAAPAVLAKTGTAAPTLAAWAALLLATGALLQRLSRRAQR